MEDQKQPETGEAQPMAVVESLKAENESLVRLAEAGRAEIVELKKSLSAREEEIGSLRQSLEVAGKTLEERSGGLRQAVEAYRRLVLKDNPAVPPEMLTGETVAAVDESLEKALALLEKIRRGIEAEAARARVPAGAPARGPVDTSSLSPREKIEIGLRE